MRKLILLILLPLVLTGCPKDTIIVKEYVDKPIYVPSKFTEACGVTHPPSKEEFMKANLLVRQTMLTRYITNLLRDIKLCDVQLESIRDWNKKQKKIYSNKQKKEEK
jgi:hypothetical protein